MPLPELAREAVAGGVDLVQVREPDLEMRERQLLVAEIASAVGSEHVAVNNDHRVAANLGVHLHLPERSLDEMEVLPLGRGISCSIHNVDSLSRIPAEVAFIVAGHLFPTPTHPDLPPIGIAGLRAIVMASPCPVVAIGGITPDNVGDAVRAGASGAAVISYVNSSIEPRVAARRLRDALERSMSLARPPLIVQVNGKAMSLEPDTTLTAFLEGRNLHPRLVVVERNHEIVAKSAYGSTILEEGDLLEIAHFVGGG